MITNNFARFAKNRCNTCNGVTEDEIALQNNSLDVIPVVTPVTPSKKGVTEACNKNIRQNQWLVMGVTPVHLLHQKNATVGKTETEKNNALTSDEQEANNQIVECRTCLRYGPNDHYCGHKLRHIREGEGFICSGKGYSPKGSPWKETTPC